MEEKEWKGKNKGGEERNGKRERKGVRKGKWREQ